MPVFDFQLECPVHDSFRVRQVTGMFDLAPEHVGRASIRADLPGPDEPWTIGIIVGPSGSGKTSVAKHAFPEAYGKQTHPWPENAALVDGFPQRSIREITSALTAVGLSSPPAWLRPYSCLSRGEQFRADLARTLMENDSLAVVDEFTSVVDRTVAKIGSAAVSRAIRQRRLAKRLVAVSCHYDILEWLEPDWVLDMATGQLARGRLRRPRIQLDIVRCHHSAWRLFRKHHYLSSTMSTACECYLATYHGEPVAFCALMAAAGRKGRWRISRLVVLPDYQGIGIGTKLADSLAADYTAKRRGVNLTTSHPAMIAALRHSPRWKAVRVQANGYGVQSGHRSGRIPYYAPSISQGRPVVTFQFTDDARQGAISQESMP
ncbi:MAG: GNAT family N-acetyltransferase [Planctomycetales bacterium]|nr:GNAT family N-acetyltransferase [Planctomycetales bacterium]